MPGGRPTKYTEELIEKARGYIDYAKQQDEIPTIEGFAIYLDIRRETVYAWKDEEDKEEFSNITDTILKEQAKTLINKGLSGEYNASITKLLLTKHNYTDKQDITSNGQTLPTPILGLNNDEPSA
jgi:hypothetical protein